MRNKDDGDTGFLPQLMQETKDLVLYRNIQRCRRFVAQQQLGFGGQRNGNHYSLAQATRKLMGPRLRPTGRVRNTDSFQQFHRPDSCLASIETLVNTKSLSDERTDSHGRIEGSHGFLEDEGHPLSSDRRRVIGGQATAVQVK